MLKKNKLSRNQKGFSLIELMVAVAILALAAFGIFQAFTAGFQGMAEARDRTEAVNYLQKTLERYRNLPFEKIVDQRITPIPGTKYSQGVLVDVRPDEPKLKKVIVQIRWQGRDGNIKTEEASTLIYSTPKTGEISNPYKIVLYATPYYRILPDSESWLTAEIQDKNNNIINDWSGIINYQIIEGESLGFLDKESELTNNGKSINRFWSGSNTGSVTIEASADLGNIGTVTDVVEITILTEGIAIILKPAEGNDVLRVGEIATINLFIVKADYITIDEEYSGTINIVSSSSEVVSNETITFNESNKGRATFTVTANKPGRVEIIASAENLEMGYTEIIFGDVGHSIKLTADDTSLLAGENTNINICVLDETNNPTPYTGTITISGGPFGDGTPVFFNHVAEKNMNFSYQTPGEIKVQANANDLDGVSIVIEVLEAKIPSYIKIFSNKSKLFINESSPIFVRIYDENDEFVTNYNEMVSFSITAGKGTFEGDGLSFNINAFNGETPSINVNSSSHGVVSVRAESTTASGSALVPGNFDINFYSLPSYMEISKNPPETSIPANGSSSAELIVEIHGEEDDLTEIYEYIIDFTTSLEGSYLANNSVYPDNGVAKNSITSISPGTATITASSNSLSPVTMDVDFEIAEPTQVKLLSNTISSWENETYITFNIEVTGSPLKLNKMEVTWKKDNLNEIAVKTPYDNPLYNPIINTGNADPPSYITEDEDIKKLIIDLGQTTIRLTFNNSQRNEWIEVILTDDDGIGHKIGPFKVPISS